MRKTFLARRNALISSTNLSWGSVALIFSVCALLLRLLAPNLFWQAAAPALSAAGAIAEKAHSLLSGFNDVSILAMRNEQLAKENAALSNENQLLRQKEIATDGFDSSKGIIAAVVARPPESPYDTLVLAAGETAGIAAGQEVFGEGNVPLGVITTVTANFSRALLFSSPGIRLHGWVGRPNVPAFIFGSGAGAMSASLSRLADAAVGDTVFAPGPGMLPLGVVVRLDSDPAVPGVTLRIMPRLNVLSLSWVQVRDIGFDLRDSFSLATSTP